MTNPKKRKSVVNVGVDVGKWMLDVCIYEKGIHWQDENSSEGIMRILKRLSHYRVERLVMEATGRYQLNLAAAAYDRKSRSASSSPYLLENTQGQLNSWLRPIR